MSRFLALQYRRSKVQTQPSDKLTPWLKEEKEYNLGLSVTG
ncbi:MAG: hypothetical protein ACPGR2_01740 [Psychrobium sp.]